MSENIQKSPLPCGGGLGVGETQSIKQGYKRTSLGILPQEWEVVRLGDICEFIKTYQNARSDLNENDEISYIHYGEIHTKYKHFIDFAKAKLPKINAKKLVKEFQEIAFCQSGDLVVVDASEDYTAVAKSVEIQNLNSKAVAGLHTFLLRDKANYFANGFKGYILYNSEVYNELKRLATGISVLSISKTNLSNLQIPLPPLAEQEKIAQILSVWDKGISVLKSLIEAKTKRKKALMQRLLTPPTHPLTPSAREGEQKSHHDTKAPPLAGGVGVGYSHIENNRNDDKVLDCHDLTASNLAMTEKNSKAKQSLRFAEFTDKWQEMRLGDILEYEQPTKYLVKNTEYSNLYQTPVLTAGKTFILGKTNENFGVYKDLPIILFDDFMTTSKFVDFPFKVKSSASKILKPKTNNINLKIVFEMMQTIDFCAKDHKRYWISEYQNLTIKLPTLAEQKKIAQVLSACDKEIELLKSKFQCLKTQKKGLMQRLLNGEVRVKC